MPDLEFVVHAETAQGKARLQEMQNEWDKTAKAGEQAQDKTRMASDKLGQSLKDVGGQVSRVGQGLADFGRQASLYITAPIVGAAAAVLKFGGDFDKAMTQSIAIMGDVSREMRDKMESAAKDVARTTTFSATQAAESYFFLASAGLDAAQSIEALPKVAKFAQAGNFDMALATDLLTDAQSALGLTIKDDVIKNMENMVRVSDVLVKANTLSNATVQQFSESLTNRAGAALKLVNKEVEEGVAVLAAWADQGVKGAEAGTRLDIVLRDLQRASITNREEFDRMNISVFDGQGRMRDLSDIIGDMENALDGMSDETLRATLMQLGFQDRSIAATASLLGLSGSIKEYYKGLKEAGGITEEVARKQLEAFNAQVKLLWNRVQILAIDVFQKTLLPILQEKVLPAFDRSVVVLEGVVGWFTKLPGPVQATAVALLALVAAAGPAALILGQLLRMVGSSVTALGGAVTWLGNYTSATHAATAATKGFTAAKTAALIPLGKILAVLALVAAAVVGTVEAFQRAGTETTTMSDILAENESWWYRLWTAIKLGAAGPLATLPNAFALVRTSMAGIREEGLLGVFRPFQENLQKATREFLDASDWMTRKWNAMVNDLHNDWARVEWAVAEFHVWFSNLSWESVKQSWSDLIDSIQNKVHDLWVWLKNGDWKSWIPTAGDFADFLMGTEQSTAAMLEADGVAQNLARAQENLRREVTGVNDALQASFDRVSPVIAQWEKLTAEFERGEITAEHLRLKQDELLDKVHELSEEAVVPLTQNVGKANDELKSLFDSVAAAINPAGALAEEISKLTGQFSEHDIVQAYSTQIIGARERQMELGREVPPLIENLYGLAKAFEASVDAAKRSKEIDEYIDSIKRADTAVREFTDSGLANFVSMVDGHVIPSIRQLPPLFKDAERELWALNRMSEVHNRTLADADRAFRDSGGRIETYTDIVKKAERQKHELIGRTGELERAIHKMSEEGWTAKEIMAALGGDVDAAARAAKEMGVQLGPMTSAIARSREATEQASEAAKAWQGVWERAMGDVFSRFVKWTGQMLDTGNKFANSLIEIFVTNLFSPLMSWISKISKGFTDWLGGMIGLGPKKGFLESLGFGGGGGGTGVPGLGVGKDGISIAGIKIPIPGLGVGPAQFAGEGMTAAQYGLQSATGGVGTAAGGATQTGGFFSGGFGQMLSAGMLGGGIGSFFGQEGAMIGSMAGAAMAKLMPAFLTGPWGMAIGGGLMAFNALMPWLKEKFTKPPEEKALNELSRDFAGLSASQSDLNYFIQHSMGLSLDAVKDIRKETTTLFSLLQGLGPGATQGNQQALISALGQFGVSEAVGRGALARGFEGAFTRDAKGNYIFDLSQAARDAIERGAVDQLRIQLTQILGASDAFRQLVPGFESLIAEITELSRKAGATASATVEVEKASDALSDESKKRADDLAELKDVLNRLRDNGGLAAAGIGLLGKGGGEATEALNDLMRILKDSDNAVRDVMIVKMEEMGISVDEARDALGKLAGSGLGLGKFADKLMDALDAAAEEVGKIGDAVSVVTDGKPLTPGQAWAASRGYTYYGNSFGFAMDVPTPSYRMSESQFAQDHPDRVYHDGGFTKAGFGLLDKDELVIPLRSLLSGGKESKQSTPQVVNLNVDVNVSAPITIQGTKSDELKGAVRDDVVPEFMHMVRLNLRGVAKELAESLKKVRTD